MIFGKREVVPAEHLTETLLRRSPVWEFCNDDEAGETLVRPVKETPIDSGGSRLFGCELLFADGSTGFGYIGNLSLGDAEKNCHFLTLSVFVRGEIFHLARYFD